MTVIRPNSISGITSITAQANEINVFRSNGLIAGLNLNGVNFNTTAGISTLAALKVTGNVDVAGVLTYQDVTNVDSLGIGTFRTGINVSGGQLDVGSNIKLGNAGVVTATSFVGSGANLTSLPSQLTLSNNADNRVITGGSGTNLNGEANLTWDGAQLYMSCGNYSYPIVINSVQSSVRAVIRQTNDANANSGLAIQKKHSTLHPANHWYGDIAFEGWDGSGYHKAGLIECVANGTPANDNMPGELRFSTNAGAAGVTKILTITKDGNLYHTGGGNDRRYSFASDGTAHYLSFDNTLNGIKLNGYGAIAFETNGTNERLRIDSTGRLLLGSGAIGGTKITGPGGLDVSQYGLSICMGGSSGSSGQARANTTTKEARLVIPHYTNAEEPLTAIAAFSASSFNYLNYGGGTSLGNVATRHQFYTAANTTTTGGSEKLKIEHSGVRSFATFVDTSYHANPDPFADGSGLVYYRMNYNFQDSGLYGFHGTGSQGSPNKEFNASPHFSLVNSSGEPCWDNPNEGAIDIPNLKNSYSFSMAAWINVSSWPTSSDNDVIMNLSIGNTRVTLSICCFSTAVSDGADFYIMYGGQGHHYFRPTSKPTNTWIHVVYSVVGANNGGHRVYQNGADLTTRGDRGGGHGGSAGWAIGGNASNSERFAIGRIGSIRFFNKALSASEANTLYQNDTFYT